MIVAQKERVHIPALGVIKARGRDLSRAGFHRRYSGVACQGARLGPAQQTLRNAINHKGRRLRRSLSRSV